MKIVLFIHSLETGGAERVTTALANQWQSSGHEVTIATIGPTTNDTYSLRSGISRVSLNLTSHSRGFVDGTFANLRRIMALRRILHQQKPDVVLAMSTTCSVILALARTALPDVVAIGSERVHPPTVRLSRAWQTLRSKTYGMLDAVVMQTAASMNWIREHTSARRVAVIPNPVVYPLPANEPVVPPRTGKPFRQRILAVGRLQEQKGFDILIRVFARVRPAFPMWELVILGEGPLRHGLQAQIDELRLENYVAMPGVVGNPSDWYNSADLFVLPSRFEGFPNALIEAMAHGLPVVSFDCPTGPGEIVQHRENGLLIPVGDELALEMALRTLLSEEPMRNHYAQRATTVRDRFSITTIGEEWVRLFHQLLH